MMKDKDSDEFLKTTLGFCKNAIAVEVFGMPRSLNARQLKVSFQPGPLLPKVGLISTKQLKKPSPMSNLNWPTPMTTFRSCTSLRAQPESPKW